MQVSKKPFSIWLLSLLPLLLGATPTGSPPPDYPISRSEEEFIRGRALTINIARALCFGNILDYQQFTYARIVLRSTDPIEIRNQINREQRDFLQRVRKDRANCPAKKTEPFAYDIGFLVSAKGPNYTIYYIAMKEPKQWTYFTIYITRQYGWTVTGWTLMKGPPRPDLKPYDGR